MCPRYNLCHYEYGRHIGNRYDHPRHHRSDHVIGTASLAQCSSCIVETDKDSPLLITSVATSLPVISMFRINDRFERIRIFGLFVLAL